MIMHFKRYFGVSDALHEAYRENYQVTRKILLDGIVSNLDSGKACNVKDLQLDAPAQRAVALAQKFIRDQEAEQERLSTSNFGDD